METSWFVNGVNTRDFEDYARLVKHDHETADRLINEIIRFPALLAPSFPSPPLFSPLPPLPSSRPSLPSPFSTPPPFLPMLSDIIPLSDSSGGGRSQRSREASWATVYMTPHRTPCAQPEQLRIAPSFLQRSARDYCSALTLAASCQGVADCLLSPVLLTLVGNNWVALAATRGAMCVGALLPPRSRLRSLPRTLRRALLMRAALWAFLLPALLAVVGSDLFAPKLFLILGQRAGRTVVVSACLAAAMLVDGFLASIPAAAGGGLRLEFQLASGFEMRAPDRLLRRLRRRLLAASEAGTIGFAPH